LNSKENESGGREELGAKRLGKSYRYEEIKVAVSQLPAVNTVKPPVRRNIIHVMSPNIEV